MEKKKKNETPTTDGKPQRLTKEQLESIRGGVSTSLPKPGGKPVFYTVPPS